MVQPEDLDHLPFGAVLQYFRRAALQTQEDLARQVGYQPTLISMIERGQRFVKREIVGDFATALGLLPEELDILLAAHTRTAAMRAARKVTQERTKPIAPGLAMTLGPLIAREQEMTRLTAVLHKIPEGVDHWAVLSGEPGIGKTRLALEVVSQAQAGGMLVALGHCYREQQSAAYAPFTEVLEQVTAAIPATLRTAIVTRWPLVCRLLPDAPTQTTREVLALSDSLVDQQVLWRQVADFLHVAADGRPVVIFIDDLHWADETTLDLLLYLGRYQHNLAQYQGMLRLWFIVTCRDTEIARHPTLRNVLHALEREHLAERLTLTPLSESQTTDLLNAYLPSGPVAADVSDLIYRNVGGVPFAVVELLQGMRVRGDLVLQDEQWQHVGAQEIELPANILDEIRERVRRLHPLTQDILRDASVLGEVFAAAAVQRMGDRSLPEVEDALADAEEDSLVHDAGREGYRFEHALVQRAIYMAIPTPHRRRLHRAAAAALAQASTRRGRAAELAWHFREGDDLPQALIYSLQAGDDAEDTYAHKDAQRHYKMATSLARDQGDEEREAIALERLADVNYLLGLFNEAYTNLVRATAIYRKLQNWERLGWATSQMAKMCDPLGKVPESMRFMEALLDTFIAVARDRQPDAEPTLLDTLEARVERAVTILTERTAARVCHCIAVRLLFLGRFDEACLLSVPAIAHAQRAGEIRTVSLVYSFQGMAQMQLGRPGEAVASFQHAQRTAEACGDLEALMFAFGNLATLHELRAEPSAARRYLLQSLEALRNLGDTTRTSETIYNLGENALVLGNWQEARGRYEEAITLSSQGDGLELPMERLALLHLDTVEGRRFADALISSREAIEVSQNPDSHLSVYAANILGEPEIVMRRSNSARVRLREAIGKESVMDPMHCAALALLAWAEWELGNEQAAHDILAEACQRADMLKSRLAYVTIWRIEAIIALAERRWDDAIQALESTLALTREMPYPYAEAKALYIYGQLHRERGESTSARHCFDAALEILNRLGERFYAERIERELATLPEA
jgi:tetratricopeptide (TPR) repeat protein